MGFIHSRPGAGHRILLLMATGGWGMEELGSAWLAYETALLFCSRDSTSKHVTHSKSHGAGRDRARRGTAHGAELGRRTKERAGSKNRAKERKWGGSKREGTIETQAQRRVTKERVNAKGEKKGAL